VIASPLVHHQSEKIGYRAGFRFEPWQSFGLRLSGARSSYDDYAYFVQAPNALFAPIYGSATVTSITGDFYLEVGHSDMIAAQGTFKEATLDSGGARVPYEPRWDAELMYLKRFSAAPLTLTATARYIGARDSGGGEFSPVTLLGLKGRYAITSHFDATLELSNLINANYEIWPGYRERGFFGAVGIGIKY
jgi:outer membrane cobalamin receptor